MNSWLDSGASLGTRSTTTFSYFVNAYQAFGTSGSKCIRDRVKRSMCRDLQAGWNGCLAGVNDVADENR
jgi:hypothetical protein